MNTPYTHSGAAHSGAAAAFVIDASTLEGRFMSCPREYYYYHERKREKSDFPAGREFGKFVHDSLLARHYRGEPIDIDGTIQKEFPSQLSEDYRNAGYAKTLWQLYTATYENEPFTVHSHEGKPSVELPFAVPIGRIEGVDIIWSGRIDLIVQWPNEGLSPLDHKTKSIGGESAWDEFNNSTQQTGYVWAMQKLLGTRIDSFCINLILTRKLTATGKGIEFARQRFPVDQERIEEFPHNIMAVVRQIFDCQERGVWPMYTHSCVRKYGKCEYLDVCKSSPSDRNLVLSTGLYKDVTWSPLV